MVAKYTVDDSADILLFVIDADGAPEAIAVFEKNRKEAAVAPGAHAVQTLPGVGEQAYVLLVVDSTGYTVTEIGFRADAAAVVIRTGKPNHGELSAGLTDLAKRLAARIASVPAKTPEPKRTPLPAPPQGTPTAGG